MEIMIVVLLLNIVVPYIFRKDPEKMIFYSRVGYFFFWAIISTLIFSGMLAFMFSGRILNFAFWVMILASVVLGILDVWRSRKSRRLWAKGDNALLFSTKIIFIEILVIAVTSYIAILNP